MGFFHANGLSFNVSEGSVSSMNPTLTNVFWPPNCWRRVELELPPSHFFLDRELLFIDMKVGTHTKWLKNFQKKQKKKRNFSNKTWHFLLRSSYISIFCRKLNFHFFFLCFSAFYEFQYPFYKNTFVLKFILGIFYFILV